MKPLTNDEIETLREMIRLHIDNKNIWAALQALQERAEKAGCSPGDIIPK